MNKFTVHLIMPLVLLVAVTASAGPYAPAAGESGSTAIHMDDPAFAAWAAGYENYNKGTEVDEQWQTPEKALGKAQGIIYDGNDFIHNIVSLGRGGAITLIFAGGIKNGDGYDFAVFENSLNDTFLELAYVEVSSNGSDFFRFANDSLTSGPVSAWGGVVDPTDITGVGGKYRHSYGAPFDLAELEGISGLDVNNIGWIKIIDIVGDGNYIDTSGDVIYDPYPTSGSAGFDLDAIGVINQAVPIPGAIVLLASGLICLAGLKRKAKR